ncbi:MAG: protein kinase [Planctomycetales bacterium]|nr:protein kinase [Planctomycetales bacterium]
MRDEEVSIRGQIDLLCDGFEEAWKTNEPVTIESLLAEFPKEYHSDLLSELLQIELAYRVRRGDQLDRNQYCRRFESERAIRDIVDAAFSKLHDTVRGANEVTLPPKSSKEDSADCDQTLCPENKSAGAVGSKVRYFGQYELLQEVARGGMGVVFKARQMSLNRIVALKMILSGQFAGEEEVQRFRTEAEAAANLEHPGIVPIFEIGEYDGHHYFSMGYVEGQSLADRVADGPLEPHESASVVKDICDAMAYAHDRGVIHRDLKPANVLMDAGGQVKITDFGLAKKIEANSSLTGTGQVLGTPAYMPPEQASGNVDTVGPLSDLYSIGAILYCLITGRPPFQAASPLDTLMQVLEREPPSPQLINPQTPKDLETIALRCLEKNIRNRYASVKDLGDELGRFLRGEPIEARPLSAPARLWRWCKRKPAVAGLCGVATALVLVFSVGGPMMAMQQAKFARRQVELKQDAIDARTAAEAARKQEEVERKNAETAKSEAVAAKDALSDEKDRAIADLYATTIALAYQEWLSDNVERAEQLLNECPEEFRHWEWRYLKSLCNTSLLTLRGHAGEVEHVKYRHRDNTFLTAARDRTVRLWDGLNGREHKQIQVGDCDYVALSPSGNLFVTVKGSTVATWDIGKSQIVRKVTKDDTIVIDATISDDGKFAAVVRLTTDLEALDDDNTRAKLRVFNLEDDIEITSFDVPASPKLELTFSPDGKQLGVTNGSLVSVFDVQSGTQKANLRGHVLQLTEFIFSQDGRRGASASLDGTAIIWDLESTSPIATMRGHESIVHGVAFSPDGRQLATCSQDRSVRIWDVETGEELQKLRGCPDVVVDVAWNDNGTQLAASSIATVNVFDVSLVNSFERELSQELVKRHASTDNELTETRHRLAGYYAQHISQRFKTVVGDTGPIADVAFSPDGNLVATVDRGGKVVIRNAQTAKQVREFPAPQGVGFKIAFSPDSGLLAAAAGQEPDAPNKIAFRGEVKIWDVETGDLHQTLVGHPSIILGLTFSPDGKRLASSCGIPNGFSGSMKMLERIVGKLSREQNDIRVWDVESGEELLRFGHQDKPIGSLAFAKDGIHLASSGEDGAIRIWDSNTGKEVRSWKPTLTGFPTSLAFSPTDNQIAAAYLDKKVRIFDYTTIQLLQTLANHTSIVWSIAYSSDGKRLISASHDSSIKVWDPHSGHELLTLRGHINGVQAIDIDATSNRIASASMDSTLKIWNAGVAAASAESDDEQWDTVLAESFDGDELSKEWVTVAGEAEISAGQLQATLIQQSAFGPYALATIGRDGFVLHDTVELSFEVHSPVKNGIQILFLNDKQQGEIVEWLGIPNPWNGNSGVTIYEQNGPLQYNSLTANRAVQLEADAEYLVQIRRSREKIQIFVNGREVCSAKHSNTPEVSFALAALYGPAGSTVSFDNIEVRAPQSAIDTQMGRQFASQLFDQVLLKSEVHRRISSDSSLKETIRSAALKAVDTFEEDAKRLSAASRDIAKDSKAGAEAYGLALAQAEVANRMRPDHVPFLRTLAYAFYRNGRYEETIETLKRVDEKSIPVVGYSDPIDIAYIAMANQQLRNFQKSQVLLQRLRDMMLSDFWAANEGAIAALDEATELIPAAKINAEDAKEIAAIKEVAFKPQQAGWFQHDLKVFMSQFAANAVLVNGRTGSPDQYDVETSRDQLESTRKLLFQGKPASLDGYTIDHVNVDLDGEWASVDSQITWNISGGFLNVRQKMEFEHTSGEWNIKRLRSWISNRRLGGKFIRFDEQTFRDMDQQIAEKMQYGPTLELIDLLFVAGRRAESWEMCRQLTEREDVTSSDWLRRADRAWQIGDADDMLQSMRHSLDLGDESSGPSYYAAFVEATLGRPPRHKLPFGVSAIVPIEWSMGRKNEFLFAGHFVGAWWIGKPKSILIYRAPTEKTMTPTEVADAQASYLRSQRRTIHEQTTIDVNGRKFSSVKISGMGTGGGITGSGPVLTTQRFITRPRDNDLVVILGTGPDDEFDGIDEKLEYVLENLTFTE